MTRSTPKTRFNRQGHTSRYVRSALVCLGLFAATSAFSQGQLKFERFPVDLSAVSKSYQVHPVNLLGGPELELVVVSDGNAIIFGQTPAGFVPIQTIPLPLPPGENQHVYYGFARVASSDNHSLVILSPGSVTWYPIENNYLAPQPQVLFQTSLISQASPGPVHRYFDMALDFDGDGIDELLLPADDGFSISRRTDSGSYTQIKLPRDAFKTENSFQFSRDVPEDPTRPLFNIASLTHRRGINDLLFYDANNDGLLDLVYSSTDVVSSKQVERYDVYHQEPGLTFSSRPSQSFAVPYDSQANATFRDINLDNRLDAILVRSNMDVVNPRTVVKFYIGEQDGYQVFTRETDRFVTKDPVGLVQLSDFNNDGAVDFAMTFFSYQFGSMEDIVDLAFANKLQFKLQFFLGRGKQGFPRQPDFEQPVTINTRLENFRGNPPVMIVKDMNGDNMMDLVVRNSATEFQVFLSRDNYAINSSPAARFRVTEQASLDFLDINVDGLCDIIISDPSTNHLSVVVPLIR